MASGKSDKGKKPQKKLSRTRLERWALGLDPNLRWGMMAAWKKETTLDFIYDSQGPGISVDGEKRAVHFSDMKLFECRIRNCQYVENPPARIYFEYGEIFFYTLTEEGKRFAQFLEHRKEKPYYGQSRFKPG